MENPVTDRLISEITSGLDKPIESHILDFVKEYYHRLSGQDFSPGRTQHLYNAALLHLELAKKRQPGQHIVEIKNINPEDGEAVALVSIVTDDRPFIIDSLVITLNKFGKRLDRTIHPLFEVTRDKRHKLISIIRYRTDAIHHRQDSRPLLESFVQFEIDPVSSAESAPLKAELTKVLNHIDTVTSDWEAMRSATYFLADMVERKQQGPAFAEYHALLRWMVEDNFAFIGYCEVVQSRNSKNAIRNKVDASSISGILRAYFNEKLDILDILPPLVESKTSPLIFTKARQRVQIHRANYLDCILIDHDYGSEKKSAKRSRRVSCILGFLAGSTATMAISSIPHLRSKAAYILSESTLRKRSYAYKTLRNILETLPREMIFQLGSKALYSLCMTLLNQQERKRTRLHLNQNVCKHFFTCLVYIPRDLFNTELRKRIHDHLMQRLGASELTFNVYFSDSILTRIHFTAYCPKLDAPKVDGAELEFEIQNMAQDWGDQLAAVMIRKYPLDKARKSLDRWQHSFPTRYQLDHSAEDAIQDIEQIELHARPEEPSNLLSARFFLDRDSRELTTTHIRLYCTQTSMPLSDALPILDHMGIRVLGEHPYRIDCDEDTTFWINHFEIVRNTGETVNPEYAKQIEQTFESVCRGHAENDGFNQLTTVAGFSWHQINVLRCYVRYLKQIRLRYGEAYVIETMVRNPQLVLALAELFAARFDPGRAKRDASGALARIEQLLEQVQTLDEERIFRALLDVFSATKRTTYFQLENNRFKEFVAIKLSSREIPRIPQPAPKHEIFVYSPRVEGVHLRGGDVARGGLRWSERPEDYRTEVLGLVKAQQVKNAVIVPVGSKGGFVAKKLPVGDRDTVQAEVIRCYQTFISALLDLTDNIVDGKIVPPRNCVRLDSDDPYLVVAADKGTATFSDIANGISLDRGFWLADAFASGGSDGYDHKKMGITARGAWESVKRHFRERGKNIQTEDFTVVGIGDMAGDVFGNGMLLSPQIQLRAAFNHMHIFIDPDPDAATSYKERQRLFKLPRSSWADYNEKLISKGGGIYPRSAKSISISPQARKSLSTTRSSFTPDELINTILKADVELLWNGGIGTYVKASSESHQDAQDKNNDSLRVDANELRVKVIGEGGNLGVTQLARIEFCQLGGMCYTDAIDNSAGVDTSDHEVNIKILLNPLLQSKKLSMAERNRLLGKMEKQVAELVLHNNYVQTEIISIEANYGEGRMLKQTQSIRLLEQKGLLDRDIEFLPNDHILEQRLTHGAWLTPPELSVLLAYSKMDLYQQILKSSLPDDPYLQSELLRYFPDLLGKKYAPEISSHPLKREIISTCVTNQLVGTMGPSFHLRLSELAVATTIDIVQAYLVAMQVLETRTLINIVRELDNLVATSVQQHLLLQIANSVESCVLWLLRNRPAPIDMDVSSKFFHKGFVALKRHLAKHPADILMAGDNFPSIPSIEGRQRQQLEMVPATSWGCDIVDIADRLGIPVSKTATVYFSLQQTLAIDRLGQAVAALPAKDQWNQRARFTLAETLRITHSAVTASVLGANGKSSIAGALKSWRDHHQTAIKNVEAMQGELDKQESPDFAMLSVMINGLSRLADPIS